MVNLNIYSERYVTEPVNKIFSDEGRILTERELWIGVMKAQKNLGLNIPDGVIETYEAAKNNIDKGLEKRIEMKNKHDVKAKIEAFNIEASRVHLGPVITVQIEESYKKDIIGLIKAYKAATEGLFQHAHRGMTSRGLSDNVEQSQILKASKITRGKYVSTIRHFSEKAQEYDSLVITARTHHQAAQPTLLGRRFSMWGDELCEHFDDLERFIDNYPLRGLKGPVGTKTDMMSLLGSKEKADELEKSVARSLGFSRVLENIGQVYPRSLDFSLASKLAACGSACENFAKGMRLMSGYELVTEGFKEGQVGSSIMPHKMNTRSSERICSFSELLKMYADGASRLSGDQWEEGDVSCSAIRRGILPDMFYVSDGLCETTLTVLNEMGAYPNVISKEVDRYLPFLATTELLNAATKNGMGREDAHETIKKYAIREALDMREKGTYENNLAEVLARDSRFVLDKKEIYQILSNRKQFLGDAYGQIYSFVDRANKIIERYPEEAKYEPMPIL